MTANHDRRLVAIMVADVAGFSRLMEVAESHTFTRVRRMREEIAHPRVEEYGGRVIKTTGDGFLAEFASAIAALRCGIDIQRSVIAFEADQPIERRIRLRIGINVGDIIIDGTDIAGDGVNIAARLEAMAPVDGICISSMVHDQIRDDLGVVFEDLGQQQLKNISRPVRAFTVNVGGRVAEEYSGAADASAKAIVRVNVPDRASAPQTGGRSANVKYLKPAIAGVACAALVVAGIGWYWQTSQSAKVSPPTSVSDPSAPQRSALSIMVLPLANGTGDAQQAYIADGLTASLTSDLSRIRDAFVVSAATAFTYKGKPVAPLQVGKELGVRFVLHGSVQRHSSTFRINVQLADATTNALLWSESLGGDESDLFALQDLVTTRIANSIGREIVIVAARESETHKTTPKVADMMLRASALNLKPQSMKNHQEVEALYRQALALDPNNVPAMVGLATTLTVQPFNFGFEMDESDREKKYAEGRDLALKAKELDPDNPGVYLPIAIYASAHDDYAGARRADETALSLQPRTPGAYYNLANSYLRGGEPKRAIELLAKGIDLNPTHPPDYFFANMGWAYFMLGDNDAAIEWALKSLDNNPALSFGYALLAMAYALKGDDAKARAAVADLRRVAPNYRNLEIGKPSSSTPAAYREYYEKKHLAAHRKAGLPE